MVLISSDMTLFILLALLEVATGAAAGLRSQPVAREVAQPRLSNDGQSGGEAQFKRKRRCLGTLISLLWPQVVGPVDEGIIQERTYDEIPKTLLEYKLDRIRKKAKEEELSRLAVRSYMQKRLEGLSHADFPDFHSGHMTFVELFHRIPHFLGLLPDHHFMFLRDYNSV